jgi:hypothetical protein
MPIELAGEPRKLSPEEQVTPEEAKKMRGGESLANQEFPQNCPICGAFTGGLDKCPDCEELIDPIEPQSNYKKR